MYLKTIKSLEALGFNQYEISNFSKPSFESKHNTKYWILDDYLGLGKSAHSLWHGKDFIMIPIGRLKVKERLILRKNELCSA